MHIQIQIQTAIVYVRLLVLLSPFTSRNMKTNENTDMNTMSNEIKCKVDGDKCKILKGHKREFVNSFSLDWVDNIKRGNG